MASRSPVTRSQSTSFEIIPIVPSHVSTLSAVAENIGATVLIDKADLTTELIPILQLSD
jgi:hypothetical protein